MLSDRVKEIGISATMLVSAEAKKLQADGVNIINLSMGEPDFPTPYSIKEAGKKSIDKNHTKYTINEGTVELRTAIQTKLKRDNHLDYKLNEIIVSSGAKQSVFNAIMAIVNPSDEVILPSPYWVSYPAMIKLAQGKMVIIETDEQNGFRISPGQLAKAITPKTKAIILCNPSNPTGAAYNKQQLEALAEVAEKELFYIISDEIYEKLVFDDFEFFSLATVAPQLRDRIILVNGVSKAYAMTGWRIGYAAANEHIVEGMNKIQSHSTSHASSISQAAAIEALEGLQHVIKDMLKEFIKRREYLYNELISIKEISCYKPEGAFYLFPNISRFLHKNSSIIKVESSFDFAMHLLYEAHIAVVPGSAFGAEGHLRISYSASMEHLKEAVSRLRKAISHLT